MCILLNVKKHEKTFALNVDIFRLREFFDLYLILYNVFYIIFVYTKNWR